MLTTEQVNAIWELLDRAGAIYVERHGGEPVRQSEALEEILATVADLIARPETGSRPWTREQILEAWMHQALGFIHATTGRFATAETLLSPDDLAVLWNAISKAEHDLATERHGEAVRLDAYVDATIARVASIHPERSREQLFRAWVLKRFVDDIREAAAAEQSTKPAPTIN